MPLKPIITCEHGGNTVPPAYRALFRKHARLLNSHRGWDPGALSVARYLAKALQAPLLSATVTRLLVELNRSVGHKALFSAITRGLPRAERETIVARYYAPHRSTVERAVTGQVRAGRSVVHVGIHSFTPELDGEIRNADIGLLYDPKREQEKEFCRAWAEALRASPKGWRVRLNYPYRGDSDGLTTSLRKMFAATRYLGIEVECNQRAFLHPAGPKQAVALRRDLLASLRGVIKL